MPSEERMIMIDWDALDTGKFADENLVAPELLPLIGLSATEQSRIDEAAIGLVKKARKELSRKGLMETFLEEFGLSNKEGLALMCLAESLLRVPDAKTANKLIAEKISSGEWESHKGQSDSWLVNASTWGLMLTGRVVDYDPKVAEDPSGFMQNLTRKAGAPVIRAAMMQAMRIMGEQFVVGRTIDGAIQRSEKLGIGKRQGLCSFDMLGEGARTQADATRYHKAYLDAIKALGASRGGARKERQQPENINGISVKLSALHPQYHATHEARVMSEIYPKLLELAEAAAKGDINLCIDAEEADRLILSLKLLEKLAHEPTLGNWTGLGLALQAYQKRSQDVARKIVQLSKDSNRRLMVRLVKGAYWDSEIKHAQVEGNPDFPVWTRKSTTDLSYLACARILLDADPSIYPQFATHNAHTVAAIQRMAGEDRAYEFQRLHGMGEALYAAAKPARPVRIYAPVGAHEDLLPYLVRRLLENGANTSFVHRFLDEDVPPEEVARSPFEADINRHPLIAQSEDMFDGRTNSKGVDLSQATVRARLEAKVLAFKPLEAGTIVNGKKTKGQSEAVFSPIDARRIGSVNNALPADIETAFMAAHADFPKWDGRGGAERGAILKAMGDALEAHMDEFVALMAMEAGKTFADSIAEVREAVDFCRYYGHEAATKFEGESVFTGTSGRNQYP